MREQSATRDLRLMNEVLELRQRVAELEAIDTRRHQAEERENKAKERLVAELVKLRQRIAELESVSTEHHEAAEEIRQLTELNGDIIQSMAEGIVVEDVEGHFAFVNPAAATMLGYSHEELLGQHWTVIVPADQHPSVQAADNRRKRGETDRYELELIRKDSTRVPVLLSGSPRVKDGRFAGTLAVFTDITELRQVEEELQQSLEKLRRTFDEVTHALASAIKMKDPYTANQQRRVTQLAVAIAKEMGLPEEQIEGIRVAATVYDIGKINIPAEFFIDPDGLTELEYGIIKAHPQVGYEVLKTIDFPWPVAEIVFQHHERTDGSGYPQGLSGEKILLEARILAVADVVVAMASRQPYRSALGIDRALEEILQNRGTLYDPKVVDTGLMLFTKTGFKFK